MTEEKNEWVKQESQMYWNPDTINEELVGVILQSIDSEEYGRNYVIEETDTKKKYQTPSHKVLQNLMRNCKVGDVVKIVYLGEDMPTIKGHKPTRMYELYLKG